MQTMPEARTRRLPLRARGRSPSWHRSSAGSRSAAFAFIAVILLLDVLGREILGPAIRLLGFGRRHRHLRLAETFDLRAGDRQLRRHRHRHRDREPPRAARRLRLGAGALGPLVQPPRRRDHRLFLVGVAYYALVFVESSMATDLRAPVLDWRVWPIQLAIPIGFLSAAGRYFMYARGPRSGRSRRSSRNERRPDRRRDLRAAGRCGSRCWSCCWRSRRSFT